MQLSSNQPNSRNIARMLMTWLTVFLLVLETTMSLQRHCVGRCHKPRTNANNDGLVETMKFSAAFENDALPVSHLRFRKMCGFHWFDALSLYSYDPQHFLSFVSTWKLHLLRLNCGRRSSRLSRTIEYTTVFRTSRLA